MVSEIPAQEGTATMAPVIPVKCSEIEAGPGRVVTHFEFTIPSMRREFIAEFVPSRTSAAIKRLMRIIDMEAAGAPANDIVDALEKFLKGAKSAKNSTLTEDEVAEYRRANGWDIEPAARTPEDVYREAVEALQPAPAKVTSAPVEPVTPAEERAAILTSDGRYTVDPVARTIEPVEEIPADIVSVMPMWEVYPHCVEFWPRGFDIPAELAVAFEVEQAAAAAVLAEATAHIFGVEPAALQLAKTGNCAELAPAEARA